MFGFAKIGKINLICTSSMHIVEVNCNCDPKYICNSFLCFRYNTKSRSFKKIKVFWNEPEHIKLTYREKALEPTRVMSVFKVSYIINTN